MKKNVGENCQKLQNWKEPKMVEKIAKFENSNKRQRNCKMKKKFQK